MDDPANMQQSIHLSDINPSALLIGTPPLLIDEWQLAPKLWDAIRFEVDHRSPPGQFILTGPAVPAKTDNIKHSGSGRFAWLTMRPMSLYESGESTGDISLSELFNSPDNIAGINNLTLDDMAFLICRGGWPFATSLEGEIALDQVKYYFDAVVRSDISRVDDVKRDAELTKRILRSFSRHQGSQATIATITGDIKAFNSV